MQALEVKVVEPYSAEKFPDEKFKHHYVWKNTTYTAGSKYMTVEDLGLRMEHEESEVVELAYKLWRRLHEHLNEELPEIEEMSAALDENLDAVKAQQRHGGEKLVKALKRDPRNPNAYFKIRQASVHHLLTKAEQEVLVARVQRGNYMKAALLSLLQIDLRTNLPLTMAQLLDPNGVKAVVAFVWHCPTAQTEQGEVYEEPDLCNPNAVRDFGNTVLGLVGQKEYQRLWKEFGPKEKKKLIGVYNEADQKAAESKQGKILQLPKMP